MNLRKLNQDLQDVANKELNEDSTRIEEHLEHIRNWLQKQQHLTARQNDQFLIAFLRGCKWSLQKTKDKIDNYYTIRSFLPEIFTNKDPFLPEIQGVLKAGLCFPLPNTVNPGGPRMMYFSLSNIPRDMVDHEAIAKIFFMTLDVLLLEDDNFTVSGYQVIGDYGKTPSSVFLKISPALLKQYIICVTKAYPVRGKMNVGFNVPGILETLMNTIVKPILNDKFQKRLHLFSPSNTEKSYKIINKVLLPEEMGGQNGSIKELAIQWKEKLESYRDYFLEDAKYGSNEKLRVGLSKTYDENFGMDGSFKKLNID
ncbi:hypothetical protein FQR65_LT11432 [Abscondita terminalis]|nr:hypothetical protein FQR65_LT11432 [Abscondita terminalis]